MAQRMGDNSAVLMDEGLVDKSVHTKVDLSVAKLVHQMVGMKVGKLEMMMDGMLVVS